MPSISFTIPGKISGKGRARTFQTGKGFLKSYTPENTRNAEAMIRDFAAQQMKSLAVFEGPVELYVKIFRLVPPSWTKKRQAAANFIVGKPDVDNTLKMLADSMQSIVYRSDAQIAVATIQRRWDAKREEVYVLVRTLEAGSLAEPEPKGPVIPGAPALRLVDVGPSQNRPSAVVERNHGGRDRPAAPAAQSKDRQPKGVP